MARILVAHNYHLALDPHARAEMKPYPPLGTVTVATELRAAGHDVAVYDATFHHDPADFALVLDGHAPERVLLVADYHAVLQKMCLTAQRDAGLAMVGLARERGAAVVVAGPDATDQPAVYLEAGAHAVIRGEPDQTLVRWLGGEDLDGLPGVTTDPARPSEPAPPRKLDNLPLVDWDLVDLRAYADRWRARHGYFEAVVSTARGCPYRCNWCAKPVWGRGLALRPPEAVVAEVRELASRGADQIWFSDDIFALKPSWLRAFRAEVERSGGILPYRCLSRADLMASDRYVGDLAASGCIEVWMGAESGSQHVLDAMDKDQTVGDIEAAATNLRNHGVRVGFFLQLGYPGEVASDVQRTIQMVRRLRPDEVGISVSYPLPGTPFYDRVRDKMTGENWETAMDCTLLFEGAYPQPFYTAAREVIRREHAVIQSARAVGRLARGAGSLRDLRRLVAVPRHVARLPVEHVALRWHARRGAA